MCLVIIPAKRIFGLFGWACFDIDIDLVAMHIPKVYK